MHTAPVRATRRTSTPRRAAPGQQGPLHQLRQGVLFWESEAEAARFVNNFQQIVSTDLYWFTIPGLP